MHVTYIIMISETLLLSVINFSCLAQTQLWLEDVIADLMWSHTFKTFHLLCLVIPLVAIYYH